jgi:hypothetical protein
MGDFIDITIPAEEIFSGNTENELKTPNTTLDNLGKLLQCYQKITVQVIVHTHRFEDAAANKMLEKEQGEAILNYFDKHDMDARFIVIQSAEDHFATRQDFIEITTQRLP